MEELYNLFCQSAGVNIDSRTIEPGQLFIALKGDHFDGNEYALDALDKGAIAAIVDDTTLPTSNRIYRVENCLKTLQHLAGYHRRVLDIPVFAITGSNGKTTTKDLISAVLKQKYNTTSTSGNFNNLIGVPITVLQASSSHELLIVEMGTNAPGEIEQLCEIASPDYGLITNIGAAHTAGLVSVDGVLHEKLALYRHVQSKDGILFVPQFDNMLMHATKECEHAVVYGFGDECLEKPLHYQVRLLTTEPKITLEVPAYEDGLVESPLFGVHNAYNLIAALAVGAHFGVPIDQMKSTLSTTKSSKWRSEIISMDNGIILLDAYNANPVSMAAALKTLSRWPARHKYAILGDMKELGEASKTFHHEIWSLCQSLALDDVLLVGDEFAQVHKAYKDVSQVMDLLRSRRWKIQSDYALLIKGSRSMNLELLMKVFDERGADDVQDI